MKKEKEELKLNLKCDGRQRKVIEKYGYEYILVAVEGTRQNNHPEPCFMGYSGFALQKVKKINK